MVTCNNDRRDGTSTSRDAHHPVLLLLGKKHILLLLANMLQVLLLLLLVQVIEVMMVVMQVVRRDELGRCGSSSDKDFTVSGRCGCRSVIAHLRMVNGADTTSSRFLDERRAAVG
jgi:hypothetical protein